MRGVDPADERMLQVSIYIYMCLCLPLKLDSHNESNVFLA